MHYSGELLQAQNGEHYNNETYEDCGVAQLWQRWQKSTHLFSDGRTSFDTPQRPNNSKNS